MDGEIDIEEHDLMENPAIKKIFPDISILKKEINYYGEEETTMKQVCLDNSLKDSELVPSSLANTKVYESNTNTLEISKKYLPSCNINLNNVDQSFMVEIKESGKQTHKEKNIHNTISQLLLSCKVIADRLTNIPIKENALSAKKMQSNKIILGSKPNKEIDYEEFFKKQVNLHELRVLVDDLKPYLERSKRYCGDCYILFPTTSEFENHLRIIHFHLFTPRKTGFRFKYQKFGHSKFRCTICKGIYSTNGSLTRHYKNIHCIQKSSNKTATMRSNIRNKNHKLIDNRVPENRTKENPQLNYRSNLNLSNQTEKNDSTICDTFVLKSTLFKCIKCDVHFVSSKTAKNHLEHMEMLINWKCCICQRIFKENDSVLHEKQHSFSNSFTVYELKQSDLAQVLYSCPKCAVHFNEEFFLNHYPRCGLETAETVYCKICDILLDRSISTSHETSHLNWGSELTKTSTVVCDILIKEAWDNSNSVKGTKECKRKSDTNFKGPVPKKKKMLSNTEFICNLLYCSICKCFVSIRQRNLHFSSRCKNLKTRICIICGLVITNKSYANHLILHEKMQNLKLQDFRFIDIKTGKLMCPPVPEFKKCNNCQVNFVTKMDICRHKCMDDDFLTCHICQMKLSEDAFKLHMSYHYYSIKNRKVGRSFSSILPKLYSQIDINIPFEGRQL